MALQNHQTVLTRQSFHKASCKVNPSVTRVTIFVAVALLTISSPTPVKLTPQNSLA
jgi:hypothetical protein